MSAETKILIIEDDENLVKDLSAFITDKYKFSILTALKGEEGFDLIVRHEPDIVILDIMLPGKDGFAICEDIRSLAPEKRPQIILLTMLTSFLDKMEAGWKQKTGARGILPKPVNNDHLSELIDSIIKI